MKRCVLIFLIGLLVGNVTGQSKEQVKLKASFAPIGFTFDWYRPDTISVDWLINHGCFFITVDSVTVPSSLQEYIKLQLEAIYSKKRTNRLDWNKVTKEMLFFYNEYISLFEVDEYETLINSKI
ncbi:MAG: hypothetical protein KKA07_13670, partial [Bacteroidetes bacterium]|nr:hypothetical protein [Bacteroidota bacterium]